MKKSYFQVTQRKPNETNKQKHHKNQLHITEKHEWLQIWRWGHCGHFSRSVGKSQGLAVRSALVDIHTFGFSISAKTLTRPPGQSSPAAHNRFSTRHKGRCWPCNAETPHQTFETKQHTHPLWPLLMTSLNSLSRWSLTRLTFTKLTSMPSDEFLEGGSAMLLWEGTLAYHAVTQAASSCARS